MSSRYGVALSMLRSTWSICRWKVWAALRRPKGIIRYSNKPNGVITAVFSISEGETGIWWKAFSRSIFEKYDMPWSFDIMSVIKGIG